MSGSGTAAMLRATSVPLIGLLESPRCKSISQIVFGLSNALQPLLFI